MGTACIT